MPRFICKPTWLQICCTLGCRRNPDDEDPTTFDEPRCPKCGRLFDPRKMRVVVPEHLILIGGIQKTHEQVAVCRCGRCKNVYDLKDKHWWDIASAVHCQCRGCHEPIWQAEELDFLFEEGMTNHDRAIKIEDRRELIRNCRNCGAVLSPIPWCPLCANEPVPPAESCLPDRPLRVWRRIHGQTIALGPAHMNQAISDASPSPDNENNENEDTQDEHEPN